MAQMRKQALKGAAPAITGTSKRQLIFRLAWLRCCSLSTGLCGLRSGICPWAKKGKMGKENRKEVERAHCSFQCPWPGLQTLVLQIQSCGILPLCLALSPSVRQQAHFLLSENQNTNQSEVGVVGWAKAATPVWVVFMY